MNTLYVLFLIWCFGVGVAWAASTTGQWRYIILWPYFVLKAALDVIPRKW